MRIRIAASCTVTHPGQSYVQSRTEVLTHLSKTNAFYQRPSVIEKKHIFFVDSQTTPLPLFNVEIRSVTLQHGYNIEKGRGGRNVKLGD